MSFLGIDIGTSGCKAGIFSETGQPLASAYAEFDAEHPAPGYAQLNAVQAWETVKRVIRQAAAQTDAAAIRSLAVSSMGEAMVPVRSSREILGPSIFNFDRRGEEFLPGLREKISDAFLYQLNGNVLGNNYSLTKLLWMQRYWPDIYERADFFLHWSGFIAFMLGAEPALDYSLANRTLLFDLALEHWSPELANRTGLDTARLPRLVPAGTVIGSLSSTIAREIGLPSGTAIVAGGHDQNVNAVGCGAVNPGQASVSLGTFICITPVFSGLKDPAHMISQGLNTEHHVVPGRYVSFIYNEGGALLKWFRDTFAQAEKPAADRGDRDLYGDLLAEMPEKAVDVLALPNFMQTGPPHFIQNSSGVILGLKLETKRGEILKGLLQGASFYLKECINRLPEAGIGISDYRVVGGGSKSDAWVQLNADIFGIPFIRPAVRESGTLGDAILAAVGVGAFQDIAEGVAAMVKLERTFNPDPRKTAKYLEKYDRYQKIWPLLGDFLRSGPRGELQER